MSNELNCKKVTVGTVVKIKSNATKRVRKMEIVKVLEEGVRFRGKNNGTIYSSDILEIVSGAKAVVEYIDKDGVLIIEYCEESGHTFMKSFLVPNGLWDESVHKAAYDKAISESATVATLGRGYSICKE